jgi:ankyrin repeat domain-containing protein 11/12
VGIVKLLLTKGANINMPGLDNDTPLHDAAYNGQTEVVKVLLEHKPDVTARNRKGQVPADVAADKEIKKLITQYVSYELSRSN